MSDMDLDSTKETIAEVVNRLQTSEDLSVVDISQIVFSTLIDQAGEILGKGALASFSNDLANFIFDHQLIDIPEMIQSVPAEELDRELEGIIAKYPLISLVKKEDQDADRGSWNHLISDR